MNQYSREEILTRIRRSGPRAEASPRRAAMASTRSREEIIHQFVEFATEYKAHVIRIPEDRIAVAVHELLADHQARHVILPADLPSSWWSPAADGLTFVSDDNFDHRALDGFDAVLTGCAFAVAETGTFVLDAGPHQGRRALTLIPDHHICVVRVDQILDSVAEAVVALRPSIERGQPLTWISGPSATSDIELSRVEGVHGPRILDIIVAD